MAETEGICSIDSLPSEEDTMGKSAASGVKHINGLCVKEKLASEDNHITDMKEVNSVVLNGEHKVNETGDNSKCNDQHDSKPSSPLETPDIDKSHDHSEGNYSNGIDSSSSDTNVNIRKPSLLLAKARDSLKDIQAKVRTTPTKTDNNASIPELKVNDGDGLNHAEVALEENGISGEDLGEANELIKKTDDNEFDCNESKLQLESENTKKLNGSLVEEKSNEEHIEDMVISESLKEEESPQVNKESKIDKSEKSDEDELLGSGVEEGIHMEIGSDNEDDLLMIPEEQVSESGKVADKTLFVSSEKDMCVSFDDDSNSNMNSDKVNDAIKLLSHDLSGTQSPLPSLEQESQENEVIELNDSDLDVNKVKEKLSKIHTESSEQQQTEGVELVNEKENNIENNEDHMETAAVKDDSKEIVEIESSPEISKKNCKLKDEEGTVKEDSKSENAEKEEVDDDVIFKGESKIDNSNTKCTVNVDNTESSGKNEDIKIETESKNSKPEETKDHIEIDNEDKNEKTKEVTAIEIDDDDVIFEKETKIDVSEKITNKHQNGDNDNKEDIPIESSKEIKSNEITDKTTDSNMDLTVKDSKTCDIKERKRPAEETEFKSSASKRSKMNDNKEIPIAKDSKEVEQPTSIELSDSDEDSDSSNNGSNVPKSRETYLRLKKKKEEKKMITITKKELEDLVRTKVKEYLSSQRDKLLTQLSQKCQDFQSNNDLWKRKVKDLQVKVNDVTVLQQKHEKRKAHTAALRQINTRNVGVQVDDGRTSNGKVKQAVASPVGSSPTKLLPKPPQSIMAPVVTAPPGANGMIRLPIPQSSLPSPVLQQSLPQTPQLIAPDFKTPTVKSLLGTTKTQPTISSVPTSNGTVSTPVLSVQYPQRVVTHTPTTSTTFITLPPGPVVNNGNKVVKTGGNAKIIDLTDDEPARMIVSIPQAMSGVTTQTGVQTIISPTGSQIVRPGTFQLVLQPGPQTLRPGTIVTGLPQTFIQSLPGTGAAPLNTNVNQQPSQLALTTVTNRAPPPLQTTPAVSTNRDVALSFIHPAPFPPQPSQPSAPKAIPPKPSLRVSRTNQGIVLSWNMALTNNVAEIASYQLFAYQETSAPPSTSLWKKVGDVKALPLPMACTLTQFQVGNKYHFAVRALDIHGRVSLYSDPSSLHMTDNNTTEK